MTAEEFAAHILTIRNNLYNGLRANLPADCEIVKRYIINTTSSDEDWIAALRNKVSKKIRILVILPAELGLGELGRTAGGNSFSPTHKINIELYHEYNEVVTEAVNSEDEFLRDVARLHYTLGQNRVLAGSNGIIERANLRMGIRPSRVQALHKCVGEINVKMTDVRYEPLQG